MNMLFICTTRSLGEFYVVEKSFELAKEAVESLLDSQNYGFRDERRVTNIRLLSTESAEKESYIFVDEHRLIVAKQ